MHTLNGFGVEAYIDARRATDARFALLPDDVYVYGPAEFAPFEDFKPLLKAVQSGRCLGAVGMFVSDASFCSLDGTLRSAIGEMLRRLPFVFTADELSAEWMLHFGVKAQVGGVPAWLLPEEEYEPETWDAGGFIVDNVEDAIGMAATGRPMVLAGSDTWGSPNRREQYVLTRWAQQFGIPGAVVFEAEAAAERAAKLHAGDAAVVAASTVEPARVLAAKWLAEKTLAEMFDRYLATLQPKTAVSVVAEALGQAVETAGAVSTDGAELVVGEVFDPATHYTSAYFGSAGGGIRYTRPDGTKDMYYGPARDWEGFAIAARILSRVVPKEFRTGRLLDLGCGPGSFVRQALEVGFDARGMDISAAAIAAADESVRERLVCADVAKIAGAPDAQKYAVISALDFWEHIYLEDLPRLQQAVARLLVPGGLGFFIICTRGRLGEDWTIGRGDVVTRENGWLLVSGHVTIRRWGWWARSFDEIGLHPAFMESYLFRVQADEDPGMRTAESWRSPNLLIVRKEK